MNSWKWIPCKGFPSALSDEKVLTWDQFFWDILVCWCRNGIERGRVGGGQDVYIFPCFFINLLDDFKNCILGREKKLMDVWVDEYVGNVGVNGNRFNMFIVVLYLDDFFKTVIYFSGFLHNPGSLFQDLGTLFPIRSSRL